MALAPELLDEKGEVDITKAIERQPELNLAISEVQIYVRESREARVALGKGSVEFIPDPELPDYDETYYGQEDDE
jgi:hypothetical protein